ncbi:MAG TPA: M14 family zinc carboxypeptidase [Ilumatobacter sp.]
MPTVREARRSRSAGALATVALIAAGCATASSGGPPAGPSVATAAAEPSPTTPATTAPATTAPATTAPADTTSTTPATSTTSTIGPSDTAPGALGAAPRPEIAPIDALGFPTDTEIEIGRSVEGRPITVIRRGDPAGTRVMVVGVIHGDEDAGTAIVDRLAADPVAPGIELWLVRSINPDGQARQVRQNSHDVDLNRNFPTNWDVLGEPGDWQYGGPGPASEPETRAAVALGESVRPDVILWYHQDLFRISPGSGRAGEIRTRYAAVAGLPVVSITGGTYTGTASQWSRSVIADQGVGITVELGPTLSADEVVGHIEALVAIATEFF